MEELKREAQQTKRLLVGWKTWQVFLLGALIHLATVIFSEHYLLPLLNIDQWIPPARPCLLPIQYAAYGGPFGPLHELTYLLFNNNASNLIETNIVKAMLLCQTFLFGYFFVRSARVHGGVTRQFLLSFTGLSAFNLATLWVAGWWMGLLNNRLRPPRTERVPLIGDGDLPGETFVTYFIRGLFLYGRIALPIGLLMVVWIFFLGGLPPHWLWYFTSAVFFSSGVIGLILFPLLETYRYFQTPPTPWDALPMLLPGLLPLALLVYFAWQCSKVGCIPKRFSRLLIRFTWVNSGLMLILVVFWSYFD